MQLNQLNGKEYLGDGVYIGHDSHQLWLVVTDGITTTASIALEMGSGARIQDYQDRLIKRHYSAQGYRK